MWNDLSHDIFLTLGGMQEVAEEKPPWKSRGCLVLPHASYSYGDMVGSPSSSQMQGPGFSPELRALDHVEFCMINPHVLVSFP